MPAKKDLEVWKGNTFVLPLLFQTIVNSVASPIDLTGSTLVFRAVWNGGSIRKETPASDFVVVDAAAGKATLTLSATETRSLPFETEMIRYEIERRTGAVQTSLLYGYLVVKEWANDD